MNASFIILWYCCAVSGKCSNRFVVLLQCLDFLGSELNQCSTEFPCFWGISQTTHNSTDQLIPPRVFEKCYNAADLKPTRITKQNDDTYPCVLSTIDLIYWPNREKKWFRLSEWCCFSNVMIPTTKGGPSIGSAVLVQIMLPGIAIDFVKYFLKCIQFLGIHSLIVSIATCP